MRTLREDERDEIESVKHLVKYINTKPDVQDFEVYNALMQLDKIAKKYVISNIVTEDELDELIEVDDLKELIGRFMNMLIKHLRMKNDSSRP